GPPDDHGEERRLLLPPPRDGHPEHGPGDPALGVPQLGVVGEVAGEADARLGQGASLLGLSGRAAVAPVWPQAGTGTTRAPPMMVRRRSDLRLLGVEVRGFEPLASSVRASWG